MFPFKKELPTTLEQLNEHSDHGIDLYDEVLMGLYALILVISFCLVGSYVAEKLNMFSEQIERSF